MKSRHERENRELCAVVVLTEKSLSVLNAISKIKCIDIRPHKIFLENVDFVIGDIIKLPFKEAKSR